MTPPVRPERETEAQRTAREAEAWQTARDVAAWEASKAKRPVRSPAELAAANRADPERQRTPGETVATQIVSLLDAATFGGAGLAADMLESQGVGGTMAFIAGQGREMMRDPVAFRNLRDARQAEVERLPSRERVATGVAGGLMNPVGAIFGPAKVGAGLFRMGAKGALEGMAQGALQGFGENVGTTRGAGDAVAMGAAGGGLFGAAAAPIAARVAGGASRMDPIAEAAARRAAEAARTDRALGHTVPVLPTGAGMPRPMDIDRVGPESVAQARGATRSVQGREAARGPFEARMAEMPEALTGDAPDAIAIGNRLRAERKAQADADYGAAIEVTKGQPVESPWLDKFFATRAGRAVWAEIQASRPGVALGAGDASRNLPTVTREGPEGAVDEVMPDPEAIHEMTRWLRDRSKTAKGQVFPDGVGSTEAGAALRMLEQAQAEMHPLFRVANDNYRAASEPIDALEMGRRRWATNPTPGKKGDRMAVTNVRSQMAEMSPEAQDMLRVGKQYDLATRVNEGKLTPANAGKKLDRPASTTAWEAALSASPLPKRLRAWNDVASRQSAVLSGKGPASRSGLLGVMDEILGGTSMLGKTATAWRILRGRLSADARDRIGQEDAAYIRLLTSDGETERVIQSLAPRDRKMVLAAQRASAQAGKQGGLLAQ